MNHSPHGTLLAYVRAFETLDQENVLPFYNLPCMFVAPPGAVVVSDATAARALVSQLIEQARGQGYRRTELRDVDMRLLSERLALVAGVFVRFGAGDQEIARFGFQYTMRNAGDGWKIVVALAHDLPGTAAR